MSCLDVPGVTELGRFGSTSVGEEGSSLADLTLDPDLMLYDEPTTGLDPIMTDVINELILRVRKRSPVTSVVVTHDMHTAQKVPDRVVMLLPFEPTSNERTANDLRWFTEGIADLA